MLVMNPTTEKTMRVKAIAGFVMHGREPVKEGEEVEVTTHLGLELIHANKAERVVEQKAATPAEPTKEITKDPSDAPRKSK